MRLVARIPICVYFFEVGKGLNKIAKMVIPPPTSLLSTHFHKNGKKGFSNHILCVETLMPKSSWVKAEREGYQLESFRW